MKTCDWIPRFLFRVPSQEPDTRFKAFEDWCEEQGRGAPHKPAAFGVLRRAVAMRAVISVTSCSSLGSDKMDILQ